MANQVVDENTRQRILELYPKFSLKEVSKRVNLSMKAVRAELTTLNVPLRTRGRPRQTLPLNGEVRLVDDTTAEPRKTVFEW